MTGDVLFVAGLALQEALRRKVLAVVGVLSVASGVLYVVGCVSVKDHVQGLRDVANGQLEPIVPATLLGLSAFGTLFLGSVLAVFLTAGAVRGDVDRGLVQPLVVRPLGRTAYLLGRALAAVAVAAGYVLVVFVLATVTTRALFPSLPGSAWVALPYLVVAVTVVTVLTLLVSCLLSTVATGITVLMAYGAGLIAGLLGEVGSAFQAQSVIHVADAVSYALPFEALYRSALSHLSPGGLAGQIVQLGPLGGAHGSGGGLWAFVVVYLAAALALAAWRFRSSDL